MSITVTIISDDDDTFGEEIEVTFTDELLEIAAVAAEQWIVDLNRPCCRVNYGKDKKP